MSNPHMLNDRKRLLGIDRNTIHSVRLIRPILVAHLDAIIEALYHRLFKLPECTKLLAGSDPDRLKAKQKKHWSRMLECGLDGQYVRDAIRIGDVHFKCKIPPHVYLAAYNHVQSLMISQIAKSGYRRDEVAAAQAALSRIVTLDMDLALTAYTRAFWSQAPSAPDHETVHI